MNRRTFLKALAGIPALWLASKLPNIETRKTKRREEPEAVYYVPIYNCDSDIPEIFPVKIFGSDFEAGR